MGAKTRTGWKNVSLFLSAFTLLEVLIAVTILAIVLTMCYSILTSTLNARKWIQNKMEVDRAGNRLLEIIARDLQAIYMYQIEGECLIGKNGHSGAQIDFITNLDSLVSSRDIESDLCEVGYYLEPNGNERGMFWLVRREDFFVDEDILKGGNAIRLCDRVASFELQFYDAKGVKDESWNSKTQKGLPVAIEVILGIAEAASSSAEEIRANVRHFRTYIPIVVSPEPPQMEKPKSEADKDKPR